MAKDHLIDLDLLQRGAACAVKATAVSVDKAVDKAMDGVFRGNSQLPQSSKLSFRALETRGPPHQSQILCCHEPNLHEVSA